ncbi:hypothetical protein ACFL44_01385 [Gemmatimonadota bacterium]
MGFSMNHIRVLTVMVALFALSGCKVYTISTGIERNGACERTVVIEMDTDDTITDTAYPVPDSTTWDMEFDPNGEADEGEDVFFYTFSKRFRSVRALEREFTAISYPDLRVKPHVELEKRHRWFATWLTFRESYEPITIYHTIPAAEWFSTAEIELLVSDEADSTLEARSEEWLIRNLYDGFFTSLRKGVTELRSPAFTPAMLDAGRDRLYQTLVPAIEDVEDGEFIDFVLESMSDVYETGETDRLRTTVEEISVSLEVYFDLIGRLDREAYAHSVTMPGLITGSNADEEELNSVSWEIEPDILIYSGVEMWVESRVSNRLAIWISIVAAIALLAVVVRMSLRRT